MLNCLNTPLQITIVRSYRAAMFVLHVDTYKARAIFAPRSPTVKKYYEASLSGEITRKHPLEILRLQTLQISLLCFGLSIFPPPPTQSPRGVHPPAGKWSGTNQTVNLVSPIQPWRKLQFTEGLKNLLFSPSIFSHRAIYNPSLNRPSGNLDVKPLHFIGQRKT